jgi:hypothetical protein
MTDSISHSHQTALNIYFSGEDWIRSVAQVNCWSAYRIGIQRVQDLAVIWPVVGKIKISLLEY